MRNGVIIFLIVWLCFPFGGKAQEERVEMIEISEAQDSIRVNEPDSVVQAILMEAEKDMVAQKKMPVLPVKSFKPDPNKALLLAIVPGLGQIYNRKYWKLPIVYGAAMGCIYAITWNGRNYQDYWGAYKDVMYDADPDNNVTEYHESWQAFLRSNETAEQMVNNTSFHERLKRRKDYFRRYRDLSIIVSAGVYLISVLDAYVDAQLFDFDISPDLSMRVEPVVTPSTRHQSSTVGLNCSIKF